MITILLLILIYLAFISLGLPDSLLGVSLPSIQLEWGLPLSAGGAISMTVVAASIVSSIFSGPVIKRFGTGKIVFISCLLTGSALLGFSFSPSYIWLILLAVPLGLGGGAVDSALNNYVALHYQARHMNWLHSFWGVGATMGPVIMAFYLSTAESWRPGYRAIAAIQLSLAIILALSLPLWRKADKLKPVSPDEIESDVADPHEPSGVGKKVFAIPGVFYAFGTLMLYCAVEAGIGLWGSSYLIGARGLSMEKAANWMALYYGGITVGRFLSGFLSMKLNNIQMIRLGMVSVIAGVLILFLPISGFITGMAIVFIGLGLAPIFPSMLHETPNRFGREFSQQLIGYQMGIAYIGTAFLSPLLGVLLQFTSMPLFPFYIFVMAGLMFIFSERLNGRVLSKVSISLD